MEEISVNGEIYVKSLVLAKKYGYTSDYLGQLCRGGDIKCTMVGRTWYVHEQSLLEHKKTRYRSTAAKSKSTLRKMASVEVGQPKILRSPLTAPENRPLRHQYETDESDLLPLIKKLETVKQEEKIKEPILDNTAENKDISDEIVMEAVVSPVVIRRPHPRPRLRTIPAPSQPKMKVVEEKPQLRMVGHSRVAVIALMLLTLLVETALVAGSLGLERQVITTRENAAMVLYGFDITGIKESLSDLVQKFF